jgi:hypothetical protein
MTHFPLVRARVAVRHITEDAECPEVAEKTLREFTSGLRDLRALRDLRDKAGREAGNASTMEHHR